MFNLIVGAGPLTLPKAFSMAGVLLGTLLLVFLAFMSFMTTTFMIEAMANANAYSRYQLRQEEEESQRMESQSVQKDFEVCTRQVKEVIVCVCVCVCVCVSLRECIVKLGKPLLSRLWSIIIIQNHF